MEYKSVAVILPVYNGERYLRQAIDSVLAQTFTNFEFYICDDCSKDSSIEIIESYKDDKITFLRNNNNQGLFSTLNRMIRETGAPLVKLWAQDDIMKSNCLEEMVKLHNQHPEIGMSYCAYDTIDDTGNVIKPTKKDNTPTIIKPLLANQIMFHYGSITGNIANVMLARTVLDELGSFREDMKVSGDYEMWVRICGKYTIGRVKEPLIFLRDHDDQFSRAISSRLKFAVENEPIRKELFDRLPEQEKRPAKRYEKRFYYVNLLHIAIRSALIRDFKTTFGLLSVIKNKYFVIEIFVLWLVTLNHRLFRQAPNLSEEIH